MAGTADITVVFGEPETLALIQLMAAELQSCYEYCDEVSAMLGQEPFPRNPDVITKIKAWGDSLRAAGE